MGKLVPESPLYRRNKRVAITVTAAFLTVNGYRMAFTDVEAFAVLTGLYETGRMRFSALDAWLRQHATAG